MKQLIRKGVFETNSSSCHSISLGASEKEFILDTLYPDQNGIIILEGGEFGWEEADYNDAETKANYMAVYANDWSGNDSDKFKDILKSVIKEQTGCTDVIIQKHYDDWDKEQKHHTMGYIDHQSVEDQDYHYLFQDPALLKNFIFNKNSVLTTDNDNH